MTRRGSQAVAWTDAFALGLATILTFCPVGVALAQTPSPSPSASPTTVPGEATPTAVATPAEEDEEPSVVLLDDAEIVWDYADLVDGDPINVAVCNFGEKTIFGLNVVLGDFSFQRDEQHVPSDMVLDIDTEPESIQKETCTDITISAKAEMDLDGGDYTGNLIIYGPLIDPLRSEITISQADGGVASLGESGDDLLGAADDLAQFALAVLAWGALTALMVLAVAWALWLYKRTRRLFRRIFPAGLTVVDFTGSEDHTKSVTTAVKDALSLTNGGKGSSVDVVENPPEAESATTIIAEALKDLPQGKYVAPFVKLVRYIRPRDRFRLEGAVLSPGERGLGIHVSLSGNRTGLGSIIVWERDYLVPVAYESVSREKDGPEDVASDEPMRLYLLAIVAATWAQYRILEHLLDPPVDSLGTSDWRSHAFFRMGVEAREDVGLWRTESFFARSLAFDSSNRFSLYNLAFTDSRLGDYEQAIGRFDQLVGILKQRIGEDDWLIPVREPLFYKSLYNLGATSLHMYRAKGKVEDAHLKRALEFVGLLLSHIEALEKERQNKSRFGRTPRSGDLWPEVEKVRGPATILYAGLLDEIARSQLGPFEESIQAEAEALSVLYGLLITQMFLQLADEIVQVLVKASEHDADEVVQKYMKDNPAPDFRTRYNLACFFAGKKESGAKRRALHHLSYALETGELIEWAQNDPSLEPLRRAPSSSEFSRLIARYEGASGRTVLGRITQIGHVHAKQLARENASTIGELLRVARRATDRAILGEAIGVSEVTIERWARLVELAQIPGIGTKQLNLLNAAGISNLAGLKAVEPNELTPILVDLKTSLRLDIEDLKVETVTKWKEEASKPGLVVVHPPQ